MNYAQKAITVIRTLPGDAKTVKLWQFPEEDFDAWRAMPETPKLESYGEYLAVLSAIQADIEGRGMIVTRMDIPVAMMIDELTHHGWPNDTQHRAKVLGLLGACQ